MKKTFTLLLSALMVTVLLSGCGGDKTASQSTTNTSVIDNRSSSSDKSADSSSSSSVVDNRKKDAEPVQEASFSENDFDSIGYLYENSIGTTMYYIVVKNNSEAIVSVNATGQAIDKDNNIIGADDGNIDVLGPGEESILYLYFSDVSGVDHVDYELSYSAQKRYKPVVGDISLSQTINDQNITIVASNNGSINAQFVQAYALFFDENDNVVKADSAYITDNDNMIKPGATLSAQLDCRESFDHVLCFLTGRSDGSASTAVSEVSEDQFDITEYSYIMSNNTMYYLVVKNNSDKNVSISFNGTGYDSGGNVISADDCSIDILGTDEESIAYFYFQGVTNIDKVEYQMHFDTKPRYSPVIENLSVVQNINNNNVVLVVTNNNEYPVQFLHAYALFLDASGNVVHGNSTYVTDSDNEIKPGATLSVQLDCRDNFDTVKCYFTGRYRQ